MARPGGRNNRRPRGRQVDGILILDKSAGVTSNGALQMAKGLFNANKAGHTGSLDPLATGLLPLCFGEATKFSQFLLDANKQYRARVKLGVTTDSGDADGNGGMFTRLASRKVRCRARQEPMIMPCRASVDRRCVMD